MNSEQESTALATVPSDWLFALSYGATVFGDVAYTVTRHYRYAFGELIGDHAGNFGPTSALTVMAVFGHEMISRWSENSQNRFLQFVVRKTPMIAIAVIANINFFIEGFNRNNEAVGDVLSGLLAMGVSVVAAKGAIKRFENGRSTSFPEL
jgi:hypothetical protein